MMKRTILLILALLPGLLFYPSVSRGLETPAPKIPLAFLPNGNYEFPQVVEGTSITHDFIILNKGAGPLKIERVKSG